MSQLYWHRGPESLSRNTSDISKKLKNQKERKPRKKGMPAKISHTIIKALNLKPKGKKTFIAFAKEKQPASFEQKCTIAAYYLEKILSIKDISVNHIYTCYKDVNWRVPSDLRNKLSYTSSQKGWLDTSSMANIKLTAHGENLVEQDLPPKTKHTKK